MTKRNTAKAKSSSKTAKPNAEPVAQKQDADIQMIPLNKLVLSPKNVRKTPTSESEDAELYASIRTKGVKQNLLVHALGAKFHVHAGGRRLKALQRLAGEKHIKANHPVACKVEDSDEAEDTSASENMIRSSMHPADEFEAFATLRTKGRTEDQIAAQFGITTDLVRRRLKLASVSPDLMQLFRDGEMSLDCVMAFTLTDDHARQVEAWETVKQHYNPAAHSIRHHLTQTSYSASSKLAKFVGIDAYKKAGGTVIEDLFSERDAMHLEDPELLEKLARERLKTLADETAEVWKWAEPFLETDYDSFRAYGRVYPEPLDPDPKLEAEMAKLQARQDELESDYDEETWTEALQAEEDRIRERIYEIERIQEANVAYTDEHRKIAGCIVTINHDGEPRLEAGLVRPEDIPEPVAQDGDESGGGGDTADREASGSGPDIELPAAAHRYQTPDDPVTAARKEKGIARSHADDLRAARHQILRAHLADDYSACFDAMLYSMTRNVFGRGGVASPLDLTLRHADTMGSREALKETVAGRMLDALNEGLNLQWTEAKAPEDFALLCKLPEADKQALFAWCAAYALNQQLSADGGASPVIETIGVRLEVDVAACWRPNAENYWGRVKKDHALDMARTLIDERWADDRSGLRKPELAKSMERAFAENAREAAGLAADIAARTSRWLPDGMGFATETDQDSAGAADASENTSRPDEPDTLPAFMEDAA